GGRWLTLKVASQAQPLKQQEIIAQRDDFNRRLDAIRQDLEKETRGLYKLRMDTLTQSSLKPEQATQLKDSRRDNHGIESAVVDLAHEAGDAAALRPLATRAEEIAGREMKESDQALSQADRNSPLAEPRGTQLLAAEKAVSSALRKLDD